MINLEAFEQMKRVVEATPENLLNFGTWEDCALGHAAQDPWFENQGFKLIPGAPGMHVSYKQETDPIRAIVQFFGIKQNTIFKIFDSNIESKEDFLKNHLQEVFQDPEYYEDPTNASS